MRKTKYVVLLLSGVIAAGIAVELSAEQDVERTAFSIRKLESQTVLYTVYRGPYENIGRPIGNLYALAAQKKITPCGPIALVYLNNPYSTTQENAKKHCLTEIRIPVESNAIRQSGTLGELTDIKSLKTLDVAVMKKQSGQMNYNSLFQAFYNRINKEGYRSTDDAFEVFPTNMAGGDYTRINSEIMVPVVKIEQDKK